MNGQPLSPPSHYDRVAAPAVAWPTELDARGSAPPNQLKAVLAALAAIPMGYPQFLRSRVEPSQLLSALAVRGVSAETGELPDGTWRTVVRRQAATPSF